MPAPRAISDRGSPGRRSARERETFGEIAYKMDEGEYSLLLVAAAYPTLNAREVTVVTFSGPLSCSAALARSQRSFRVTPRRVRA